MATYPTPQFDAITITPGGSVTGITASDVSAIPSSSQGAASGVATLDSNAHLVAAQFPALTGDITTTAGSTATALKAVGTAGTYGSASVIPVITTDAEGRVSNITLATAAGTVNSVALAAPSILTVTGSPVTSAGTLTLALASQSQNEVFASPSGAAGAPGFRSLVLADLPGTVATLPELAAVNGSSLVGFLQAGTGAVARTVQAKGYEWVSVKDFGAVGNGSTDDTVAINAAETAVHAAGGGTLYFPDGGVYMVNNSGLTKLSNVNWELGGSTIKALAQTFTAPTGLVNVTSASNFRIHGGIFDTSLMATSGDVSSISLELCNSYAIEGCQFDGVQIFGIAHDGGSQFTIKNNIITKTTAANTQNQGILVSQAAGVSQQGLIDGNVLTNTAMDISAQYTVISNNQIFNWKFGGGITTEISSTCNYLTIVNNVCIGGSGTDVNNTDCEGIENWAPYSVIKGNICAANSGDGIAQGGSFTLCEGNICLNNGQTSGNGITARYQTGSPTVGANHSIFSGNLCADTQGTPTQLYGYADQTGSSLTSIKVVNNLFTGNKIAPMNVITTLADFIGPRLPFSGAWTPGTIAIGGFVDITLTVPGASFGDVCDVAFSADLQDCVMSAWVTATNSVKVQISNTSGVSVTFGAGTVTGYVAKALNYTNY